MDPIPLLVAFACGFLARQVGLPPLVGFLLAGFGLNAAGGSLSALVEATADVGVLLLLFSIGLKLRLRDLLAPVVWGGAGAHMLITTVALGFAVFAASSVGLSVFTGLGLTASMLIGFALSFSSTVFAVKVFEDKGESNSRQARIAIGILIVQDLVAVVFLAFSAGTPPSPWALLLLGLPLLRPLLYLILDRSGHGELLLLCGLVLALIVGAEGFALVDMKPDLGALVLGVLVAGHPKAPELAKTLFSVKELFLVGFFLEIGFIAVPSLEQVGVAALLVLVVPLKVALFFLLFTRLRLRSRTALFSSIGLANYSEFGLIVGYVAVGNGWIAGDWMVVIAMALSISFVLAAPLNNGVHAIYARYGSWLQRLETNTPHPDDAPVDLGGARVVVCGMGDIGIGAYDTLRERCGDVVLGVDSDEDVVAAQRAAGRTVIQADATDPDLQGLATGVQAVILAMPKHVQNLVAVQRIAGGPQGALLASLASFDDEVAELREQGAELVSNFHNEAGAGLAEDVVQRLASRDAGD